jgi:hypothetical protein
VAQGVGLEFKPWYHKKEKQPNKKLSGVLGHGSHGKVPSQQVQGPEFKPQY